MRIWPKLHNWLIANKGLPAFKPDKQGTKLLFTCMAYRGNEILNFFHLLECGYNTGLGETVLWFSGFVSCFQSGLLRKWNLCNHCGCVWVAAHVLAVTFEPGGDLANWTPSIGLRQGDSKVLVSKVMLYKCCENRGTVVGTRLQTDSMKIHVTEILLFSFDINRTMHFLQLF